MQWTKLGRIYEPRAISAELLTHAANPLPIRMHGSVFRIYFNGRDNENRSSVGFFDFDMRTREVIQTCQQPAVVFGNPGSYYADGISIGGTYVRDGRLFVTFMGWQSPKDGHWRGDVGQYELNTDLTVREVAAEPILHSDESDPISLSYPWVLQRNRQFEMWYGSTLTWDAGNGEMIHIIKKAISGDGLTWKKTNIQVPHEVGVAQAFSRPTIMERSDGLHMWFSYRSGTGQPYRIGYAKSDDGESWSLRLSESGIDVSEEGWDSEMIEYPYVFGYGEKWYMLYNGNGYGKTGIGIAVLDEG